MTLTTLHHTRFNRPRDGVFISYARSDGEAFAHRLRQQLEKQAIKLWQDRVGLEGGRDWWLQIVEALDHVKFMALVITPKALESEIVRREWRYARQQGVVVYPIKGSPEIDFNSLPRWMRDVHFYDLGTIENDLSGPEWKKFVNDLNKIPYTRRVPFMVEDLPEDFVARPGEFDQLLKLLLDEKREAPVAITAALRNAGGYGKTTLAKALCHHPEIQDAFDHGILWVTLGENPGDLTGRIEDLIQTLSGERPGFTSTEAAIARLIKSLADRDILMVIDDVWNPAHLRPFLQGGPRCARLITTRNPQTLPDKAVEVKVDAMKEGEAVELLSTGLDCAGVGRELRSLAERLCEWPLLLKLSNGVLRKRVRSGEFVEAAIAYTNRALDKRGLKAFEERNPIERDQAAEMTLKVSLDQLHTEDKERFSQLSVFPENVKIPMATLEKYWGVDEIDTEELCNRLNQLSLLLNFDLWARTVQLHDFIWKYLVDQEGDRLSALHDRLLDAYRPENGWSDLSEKEPYIWDHLASHLVAAGRGDELVATVKDWRYLAKKTWLKKSHSVESDLIKAEKIAPGDDPLRTLRRNFANTGHLFNRCETHKDIEAAIYFRLRHLRDLGAILQDMGQRLERPHIAPKSDLPDLPHPALIRTLEGHSQPVNGCAFSPDGKQIVSASYDNTLKVWEAETGEMLRTLEGHSQPLNGCAYSPDGKQIVSASGDCTLKVWEAETGKMLRTLEGHSNWVNGCAFSPDGKQIVSASRDSTLKVWDAETGEMLRTLEGHSSYVNCCTFSPGGKQIVSASSDSTLKVWDAETGEKLRTLEGHSSLVSGCAYSPDGKQVVSASRDRTLKVWDAETGEILRTLEGHSNWVMSCAFSPDGKQIVSASWDRTLKVWDADTGEILRTLEGHSVLMGCAFSPDGKQIVSASRDLTLKVWDTETGEMLRTLEGHSSYVNGCAFRPDGKQIGSASLDHRLRVWDAETGEMLRTLEGHSDRVNGCAFSPDGKQVVSASADHTLKVWDAETGEMLRTLEGHSDIVTGCAFSPDGKQVVSASADHTLKVWNAETGEMLRTLEGHSDIVTGCTFSPDGKQIVSASSDHSLRVWDAETGEMLRMLEGHSASVNDCAFSPGGKQIVSASSDSTLKIWDAETGKMLRTLDGRSVILMGCAYSPDGMQIVSASWDCRLKVWDTQTDECLATFYAEGLMLCCATYGEMIVAGGARGLYFLRLVM